MRLIKLFKRPVATAQEIESRLKRLNSLCLEYQNVVTMRDELDLDQLVTNELAWFKARRLKLTSAIDGTVSLEKR